MSPNNGRFYERGLLPRVPYGLPTVGLLVPSPSEVLQTLPVRLLCDDQRHESQEHFLVALRLPVGPHRLNRRSEFLLKCRNQAFRHIPSVCFGIGANKNSEVEGMHQCVIFPFSETFQRPPPGSWTRSRCWMSRPERRRVSTWGPCGRSGESGPDKCLSSRTDRRNRPVRDSRWPDAPASPHMGRLVRSEAPRLDSRPETKPCTTSRTQPFGSGISKLAPVVSPSATGLARAGEVGVGPHAATSVTIPAHTQRLDRSFFIAIPRVLRSPARIPPLEHRSRGALARKSAILPMAGPRPHGGGLPR